MGLVILVFALGGFGLVAFWSTGLSFNFMNHKKLPLYLSIPLSAIIGVICGVALGFGIAYTALPHN